MYLKKFIYVNWGNIPNTELDFGPISLFSGGNGSGKTTAADAVQTIMTAAHDNLFQFNPGQDESSQRGRGKQVRTLASYVLGCDDGAYARPEGCYGYLGAVFYPTKGENGEPFSVLIGMEALLEGAGQQKVARLEDIQYFILPDVQLALKDLRKEDKHGAHIVPLSDIYSSLRREFGSPQVEKYDKKKAYLCRLYGILRGYSREAVSEREAMNAARAFSRFMAYKPIRGIDEFVAGEVLEPRDLGEAIRTVSAMLKRIHTMESDARKLREAIDRLAYSRDAADSYISQWLEQQVLRYSLAKRASNDSQQLYLAEKKRQQQLRDALAANEKTTVLCQQRRDDLAGQIALVHARRLGVPALRDKDQLSHEKLQLENRLHQSVPGLLQQDSRLQDNRQAATQINRALRQTSIALSLSALEDKDFAALGREIAEASLTLDFQGLFNRDWIDISPLEEHLEEIIKLQQRHNRWHGFWYQPGSASGMNLRDQLAQERDRRQAAAERLQKTCETRQREIRSLEGNQVDYPDFVRRALGAIQQQCPQADARVLCDYVEVRDRDWQAAIEGYIGAARFGIIVEPEFEAEAIRIVRSLSGQGKGARVIQGDKARRDCEKMSPPGHNSIVHIMHFSHATAEFYLRASYGNVERVDSAEALRNTRRGLTRDAMGSGNYAMFRCDMPDDELVFGQDARERALQEKQRQLEQLTREWQEASDQTNEAAQLLKAVDSFSPLGYADAMQEMLDIQRRLQTLEERIASLDLSDSQALDDELEKLQGADKQQQQEIASLNEQRIEQAASLKNVDERCKQLDKEQDKNLTMLDQAEENLQSLVALWPDFDVEQRLVAADADCLQHSRQYFEQQLTAVVAETRSSLHRLDQAVSRHNQYCGSADSILFEVDFREDADRQTFQGVCELRRQVDKLYNRDKNHILAQRHAELESLRQSFNNAFVTNLCHSIYQAVNDGEKTLDALNRELEHHRFGADRERYRFDYTWVPEFREYYQFFKAVNDNPGIGDGASLFDLPLETKHRQVRERLMAMLLDEDEQKAMRDLSRIADYRNYRRYEIYKEPEGKAPIALSQYGTGSGGQLETPAYIIRSAAITSALRFNEGNSHLRMVLVDEAFSKMDEHRSREVINYLTRTLGLQLLFIMPSSKSGPFMDLISNQFVFSKCPTSVPVGELKTRVLLDRQQCAPEKIRELMEHHRRTIRQQTSLDFMLEVEGQ